MRLDHEELTSKPLAAASDVDRGLDHLEKGTTVVGIQGGPEPGRCLCSHVEMYSQNHCEETRLDLELRQAPLPGR